MPCGKLKWYFVYLIPVFFNLEGIFVLADMPSFMDGDRIVGGAAAPSMIPWQVAITGYPNNNGVFGMCGGTVLDACTVLSAAHCGVTTNNIVRAGSLSRTSGGQV